MSSPLRRGDVVVCALAGDLGKPRPAIVVQSDYFNETHETITLCPVTSGLTGLSLFRVPIKPSTATGIRKDSEVMIDKLSTARRARIRQRIGRLPAGQMKAVDEALRLWLTLPQDYMK